MWPAGKWGQTCTGLITLSANNQSEFVAYLIMVAVITAVVSAFLGRTGGLHLPARCRHRLVDQKIFEHRVSEGSADERCYHRLSQCRAPLSPIQCAKNTGHYHHHRHSAIPNQIKHCSVWSLPRAVGNQCRDGVVPALSSLLLQYRSALELDVKLPSTL